MGRSLSDAAIEHYHNHGFYVPLEVMSEAEARSMRAKLETYEAQKGGVLKGSDRFKSHLLFKWLADLIRAPTILDAVEDLLGPNLMVWSTDWWIKEANSPSFVSWHQDSEYWGLDSNKLVTAWIALSPSTVESGCMRVLQGSHLGPSLPHTETYHDDNMLTRGQTIENVDESQATNLIVHTGEAALFAYRIAHASYPNHSHQRRVGLAIRYVTPEVRQTLAEGDSAALVRGEDTSRHFEHEPYPTCDFDPIAVEFHKKAEEIRRRILYQGTDWNVHRT